MCRFHSRSFRRQLTPWNPLKWQETELIRRMNVVRTAQLCNCRTCVMDRPVRLHFLVGPVYFWPFRMRRAPSVCLATLPQCRAVDVVVSAVRPVHSGVTFCGGHTERAVSEPSSLVQSLAKEAYSFVWIVPGGSGVTHGRGDPWAEREGEGESERETSTEQNRTEPAVYYYIFIHTAFRHTETHNSVELIRCLGRRRAPPTPSVDLRFRWCERAPLQ